MVALKALAGSTPLAWVNVATWPLNDLSFVEMGPETTIAGSATDVVADALLFAELGSAELALTVATLLAAPSSTAWAVTVAVTVAPAVMLPMVKVTVEPETLNVPWLVVAERYFIRLLGSASLSVTADAAAGPLLVTVIV